MTEIIPYIGYLKPYARKMRNKMTKAEKKLWYKIRSKELHGVQFCRQMIVISYILYLISYILYLISYILYLISYILDFYAKEPKIAIEVDGPIHFSPKAIAKDKNRDQVLNAILKSPPL